MIRKGFQKWSSMTVSEFSITGKYNAIIYLLGQMTGEKRGQIRWHRQKVGSEASVQHSKSWKPKGIVAILGHF